MAREKLGFEKFITILAFALLFVVGSAIAIPLLMNYFPRELIVVEGRFENYEVVIVRRNRYGTSRAIDVYLQGDAIRYRINRTLVREDFDTELFQNLIRVGDEIKLITAPFSRFHENQSIYHLQVGGHVLLDLEQSRQTMRGSNVTLSVFLGIIGFFGLLMLGYSGYALLNHKKLSKTEEYVASKKISMEIARRNKEEKIRQKNKKK
ncbi:MAG: hypothetical protein FWC02_01820 [Firmicutes bacterium]|nr:hypothetical protein [Bacillota bacterium]